MRAGRKKTRAAEFSSLPFLLLKEILKWCRVVGFPSVAKARRFSLNFGGAAKAAPCQNWTTVNAKMP
jgi:hypothetical protein